MGLYDDIDNLVLTNNVGTQNTMTSKGLFDDIDDEVQEFKPQTFSESHPILASAPEALKQLGTRAVKSFPEFGVGVNDLVSLVGDKTGLQGLSDFGRSNAQFWQEQSDKIQIDPKYQGLKGLQSKETVLPTVLGSIGDQASNLLMAGGGGAAGAKAAAGLGLKGAAKAGLITAGTSIPNLAQEGQYLDKVEAFKNIYGRVPTEEELRQIQNTAIGEKAINTALETVADKMLFGKMFPQGAVTKDVKGILKNAGQQALTEAGTEGLQEGVSIGAESLLGINQGNNLERLADSMAIGGITGGVIGGVTSAAAQPYDTQFVENQNPVNPIEALKNVSAQILENGKPIYNSAPDSFDVLKELSREGAFTNRPIEEIAPNIAKSLEEQKAVNTPIENVQQDTVAPVEVEQPIKVEKKAKAKAKAIEKIKEIAPKTAEKIETMSPAERAVEASNLFKKHRFVRDNEGHVYETQLEEGGYIRQVDNDEHSMGNVNRTYEPYVPNEDEFIKTTEFKYDPKAHGFVNAENYIYAQQEYVDAYNNYVKEPTKANREALQETYSRKLEEYKEAEPMLKDVGSSLPAFKNETKKESVSTEQLIEKAKDLGIKGNLKAMKAEKLQAKINEAEIKVDENKHIWEGWLVKDFIKELEPQIDMIYSGNSINKPFKNRQELKKWCMDNQPYYKKYIPDVVNYFAKKHNIKNDFVSTEKQSEVAKKIEKIAPETSKKLTKKQELDEKIQKAKDYASQDKFIPNSQKTAMTDSLRGEEKEYFAKKFAEVQEIVENAPEMYQTQGKSEEEVKPVLHYFGGAFDLYVTEIDKETGEMYGFGGFNQDYEWGYNHISNFNNSPHFNLDLYYDNSKSVADIWKNQEESEVKDEYLESANEGRQSVSNENEEAETRARGTEKEQSETSEVLRGDGQQELRQSELSDRGITQEDSEKINKSYKNQHELNQAIEAYISNEEYKKYSEIPQEVKDWLKKYAGAGGLEKQGAEGKGLLTEYYTPQNVVNKMWELTEQYVNTDGAKVLEPSVGIGRFLENAPKNTSFDVFEMNPITAKITEILYPNANVEVGEFQKKFIDSSKNLPVKSVNPEYDVVIGNPPYGKYNSKYKGMGEGAKYEQLEAYFINRGLDTLKENGVLTYIVPSSFLRNSKGKLEIANKCEILDAYRLPNGTFGTTDIGTDIIVLRKRTGKTESRLFGDVWFKSHPEKILGEVQEGKGNWGTDIVKGDKNAVDNIRVGEKQIKETVATDTKVPSKKTAAKTTKKATTEKTSTVQKGNVEYTEYKHENRASDREMELWEYTAVDGSLEGGGYKGDGNGGKKPYFEAGEDINQHNGKLYNDFNYLQGDIYEKLEDLERENISEEQKERQRKKLLSVLPKEKEAKDIRFNPTSDFIQDFEIENAEEVRWGKKKSPIVQGFIDYINQIPSDYRDDFSSRNIEAYLTGSRIDFRIKFDSKSPEYAREKSKKMSKLKAIVEKHFTNYVAKVLDKETRDRLVKEWNRNFNNTYNPDYTKMPLLVRGLNSKFKGGDLKLKETQIEGINFLANKGVGLIGFEVGVGKTLTGIISTVQNMQMGRCKRPLIIIPKNIKKNWKEEFAETFPNIKVVDVDNMSKWDGEIEDGTVTLATYQALDNLWYDKTDAELTDMIYQLGNNFDKDATKRGKESVKERFEKMVGKALKGNKARFKVEDLGFDHVTFDEAHAGKNLFDEARADSMEKDAGGKSVGSNTYFNMRGGSQSKVALRMFLLTQHILKENNNRNVFMLTATPFNNQSLEVFNMLSYLAKDKLDKMGLYNVYQFNEHYIDVTSDIVLDANNNPIEKQVELGFKNVDTLREVIKSCMLIRTADDAKVVRPDKTVTRQKLDATEEQLYWFDQADEMAMQRDVDGALFKSISMRRNATISPDVAANNYDVTPENFIKNSPKLEYIMRCVESMKKKDAKTSQIIYMPIGVKFLGKIKQYLVDKGVYKANEIEIISSENALSNPEKEEARLSKITDSFNDREGDVKLIIGTQKIQVGMNLNKNTSTLYMPYVEWNPTDFVQTVGRMWRQGNSYKNVRVVVPLLKNSSDSFMFQKLDEKIKRMNDLMGSDKEYISNDDLQTEEEKIAMISNPYKRAKMYTLLQKDGIDYEIKKLEARKRTAQDYKSNLERRKNNIKFHEDEIEKLENLQKENGELPLYQRERLKDHKKDLAYNKKAIESIKAQIELDNIDFEGKDSAEAIDAQIEEQKKKLETLNELEEKKAAEYSVEYDEERRNIKSIDEHIKEFEKEYDSLYGNSGEDSFGDFVENISEIKDRFDAAISAMKGKKIGDLIKNNEVIKVFEDELQDVLDYKIAEMPESMKTGKLYGKHLAEQKTIFLNMEVIGNNVEQFVSTFMHEVEHAKQYKEYLKASAKRYKTKAEQEIVDDYLYCKEVNKNKNTYYNKHRQVLSEIQESIEYLSTEEELEDYLDNLSNEKRKVYDEYTKLVVKYYKATNEVKARNASKKAVERFKNEKTNRSGHLKLGIRQEWNVRAGSWSSSKGVKREVSTKTRRIKSSELEAESSESPIGLSGLKETVKPKTKEKVDLDKETAHEINQVAREKVYNWFNNIESDRYDIDKTLNSFVNLTKAKATELSRNLGFKVSDVQVREIMPFLRERTEFPKSLERDDLRKIFNSLSENDKKNLTQLADTTSEKFEKYYQNYNEAKGTPDNEGIEYHISHIWDLDNKKKSLLTNYITTNSRFAKQRTIQTLLDGIEGIEIDGELVHFKPKTLDYAEILKSSSDNLVKATHDSQLAEAIKHLRYKGELLVLPATKAPSDWIEVNHPALSKAVYKGSVGENELPILMKTPVKVHPEIADYVGSIFETQKNSEFWNKYDSINGMVKQLLLGFSGFHGYALSESAIGNMGFSKTMKELDPKKFVEAIKNGKYDIYENEEHAKRAIKAGVKLGTPSDLQRNLTEQALKQIPVIGKALSSTVSANNIILWNVLHNNFKIVAFNAKIEEITKTNGKITTEEERAAAQWVNDSFGGQAWELLGIKPSSVKTASRVLLSPDWNFSTLRQAVAALNTGKADKAINSNEVPKQAKRASQLVGLSENVGSNGARGKTGRAFWLRSALYFTVFYNLINAAFREKDREKYPHLYPKEMSPFDYSIWSNSYPMDNVYDRLMPKVFIGRNSDGSARMLRVGKQFREVPEFLAEPLSKISGKTSPVLNIASQVGFGMSPGDAVNRLMGKDAYLNQDIWDGFGSNATMKSGSDLMVGRAKTLGKSLTPFIMSKHIGGKHEFSAWDFFAQTGVGATKSKVYKQAKAAFEAGEVDKLQEIKKHAQKDGLKPSDINAMVKYAETSYKADNTRKYKRQYVSAMESRDKAKIQKITDKMRKNNLSVAETKRIYNNAYKDYMKGLRK